MIALYALLGLFAGMVVNLVADYALQLSHDRKRAETMPDGRACRQCGQPTRARGLQSALWQFAARRGHCAGCGARLPWRPVLVELAAAALFAYLWAYDMIATTAVLRLALHSVYVWVFLVVLVTDIEHRLILDALMYPAIVIAALVGILGYAPQVGSAAQALSWRAVLIGGAVGFGFFYLAAVLGQAFFGRGALGFGDVTLATFIGLVTGFPNVIVALFLGIFAGGAVTGVLLLTRIRSLRSAVPYGPFLVAGGVATLLWGTQILEWYFAR